VTDKLDKVRTYVNQMSPVYRPALLRTPEDQIRHRGYDEAMKQAQRDLRLILDESDAGPG